jgi:GH35 family endo-1,4-beta-xylanase
LRSTTTTSDVSHRIGQVDLTVLGVDGQPLDRRPVTVAQRRHAFSFGNIGFDFLDPVGGTAPAAAADVEGFGGARRLSQPDLESLWLELFNTATLPFYWGRYEPRRGTTDAERLMRTARWFADRGVTVKGHPLVWHTVTPSWLLELPLPEVEQALRHRIRDLVGGFAGLVDTWDAINEAVIMPVFTNGDNAITRLARDRGRFFMIRLAFEEARRANPSATLLINDFDLSSAYECLIEGLLETGIRIDALGLQTHMHQGFRGEDEITETLDRFARYGLPLHLTESSLVSGHLMPPEIEDLNDYQIESWPSTPEGEARQAEEMDRHYRCLVGHPAVQAITYWGLTDDGAWLGAPTGLVRADGTVKPSYTALRDLIKGEWWLTPTEAVTDADGRVQVSGFFGDYEVEAGGARARFAVGPGARSASVRLS